MVRRSTPDILRDFEDDIDCYTFYDAWYLSKLNDDLQRFSPEPNVFLLAILYMARFQNCMALQILLDDHEVPDSGLFILFLAVKLAHSCECKCLSEPIAQIAD